MEDLLTSLWLTAVGMGLVFGAILVFWLLMAAVVRLAADRPGPPEASRPADVPDQDGEPDESLRRSVAAVAVAAALAVRAGRVSSSKPSVSSVPLSPWQAVWRSRRLGGRGKVR